VGGYLDAADDRQAGQISLAGQTIIVPRARLGLHLQLGRRAIEFDDAAQAGNVAGLLAACARYLTAALQGDGTEVLLLSEATGPELLGAYAGLRRLNAWRANPAWLDPKRNPITPGAKPPYHYEGRFWATWVHEIASRYGWSREQIFQLWPEEAAYYLQEIQLSLYHEREDERALSKVSYRYNKSTKTSSFVPSPKAPWMVNPDKPEARPVNPKYLPVGLVIPTEDETPQ